MTVKVSFSPNVSYVERSIILRCIFISQPSSYDIILSRSFLLSVEFFPNLLPIPVSVVS